MRHGREPGGVHQSDGQRHLRAQLLGRQAHLHGNYRRATPAAAGYLARSPIKIETLTITRRLQVKRYSYTTSTENMTSTPKMWGMERNCTSKCEPGCIVIGERTKLYACTSCCEKSLCNSGTGNANELAAKELEFFFALSLQLLLAYALKPSS